MIWVIFWLIAGLIYSFIVYCVGCRVGEGKAYWEYEKDVAEVARMNSQLKDIHANHKQLVHAIRELRYTTNQLREKLECLTPDFSEVYDV